MAALYQTRAQIWTLVIPKAEVACLFTAEEAKRLAVDGAMALPWAGHRPQEARILLAAVGAYQLMEVLRAAWRLAERDVPCAVAYLQEPARLDANLLASLAPPTTQALVIATHTRPHVIWGIAGPLLDGRSLNVLGYRNAGGTLDTPGMLMVNGCTWAHCVEAAAKQLGLDPAAVLAGEERAALAGQIPPQGVLIPRPR
jgi:phosphoketolase